MHHAIIATLAFAAGSAAAAAQPSDPQPATSPSTWMSIDDYPAAALASHQEGSVGFALAVDPTGQVQSCSITQSSGFPVLDDATCALLKSRAKFGPARDAGGHAVAGTFASHVQWVYPQPAAAAAALPTAINLQGFKRTGYGVSVLSVDENGLVTKCELGDSGYKNIPSPNDFCDMFPVGSRYSPPALYKGKPMKRRVTLKLDIEDENVP
jgi:protein TonB